MTSDDTLASLTPEQRATVDAYLDEHLDAEARKRNSPSGWHAALAERILTRVLGIAPANAQPQYEAIWLIIRERTEEQYGDPYPHAKRTG